MLRKILSLITPLLAMAFFSSAWAISVPTLYQGEVPVASHSQADWQKAVAPALEQVLIKVSGNSKIGQVGLVRSTLPKAGNLVQSYNYASLDMGQGKKVMSLQVRFSPKAVNELLQRAGQLVLPKDRPLTIVWVATQNTDNAQPKLVGAQESKNNLAISMQKEADRLGVPLFWPAMDFTDLSAVNANQVWNLDQAAVQSASKRYQADQVLIGKIAQSGSDWKGQWVLVGSKAPQHLQTQGSSSNVAAVAVLGQLSQMFVSASNSESMTTDRSRSVSSSHGLTQEVTLKIRGIYGLDEYSALVDYLRSLDAVIDLSVLQTQKDQLVVRVKVAGLRDMLAKEISMSNSLAPSDDPEQYAPQPPTAPPTLYYRWVGASKGAVKKDRKRSSMRNQFSQQPRAYSPAYSDTPEESVQTYPSDEVDSYNNQRQNEEVVPYEVSP